MLYSCTHMATVGFKGLIWTWPYEVFDRYPQLSVIYCCVQLGSWTRVHRNLEPAITIVNWKCFIGWLNFELSETLSWTLKPGLRPKFNLTSVCVCDYLDRKFGPSLSLSRITLLFDSGRTLVRRKAKSKIKVIHCMSISWLAFSCWVPVWNGLDPVITVNMSSRSQSNVALVPSVQSEDNDYTKIKRTILLQSVASANGAEQALNDWLLVEVTRLVQQYTLMNVVTKKTKQLKPVTHSMSILTRKNQQQYDQTITL